MLTELPTPELRPGTIRLDVLAAAVHPADGLVIEGRDHVRTPPPFVPGREFVGRIREVADDVGRDAPHLAPGGRVLVPTGTGGFAEEAVVPAHAAIPVPDEISDTVAATCSQPYLTALFGLRRRARATPGASMLVIGAGSGVGLAAVDVGASMGLRVVAAAATTAERELALSRGAEIAYDLATDDIEAAVRDRLLLDGRAGVDLVFDPLGGDAATTWLRCLDEDGQYLVVGFVAGIAELSLDQVLHRNRRVTGVDWGGWAAGHREDGALLQHEVLELVASRRLDPVEPTEYPLERTADALQDLAARRVAGTTVVVP